MEASEPLHLPPSGEWQPGERRVLIVFGIVAVAWMTRTEPFGGWTEWFGVQGANDATVAFLGCIAMAIIPDGRGGRLLDWEHASRIPWGILILFGSGVAIAEAFGASGLSGVLGDAVGDALGKLSLLMIILLICLAVTFLTEVTSNTATATLLLPVIAAASIGAGLDPKPLMAAAAMSASCAFMLPVATGPNAVVYGSERLAIADMARAGLVMNFIGVGVITAVVMLLGGN